MDSRGVRILVFPAVGACLKNPRQCPRAGKAAGAKGEGKMKSEWLLPNPNGLKPNTEYLYETAVYFGKENLSQEQIAKLFASKYAYAEPVHWAGWRANKFYGEEVYQPNKEYSFVKVTIYETIGPVEPCQKCDIIYRYLDPIDLKYKCRCQLPREYQ